MTDKQPLLWCAHIRGPDDVVPCADYDSALELCDYLLHKFDRGAHHHKDDNWPYMSAVPALWPWSSEDHAMWLAKRSGPDTEYPLPVPTDRAPWIPKEAS